MVFHKKEEILTKTMAVVALATLIFMAFSMMLVPNEGEESAFVLRLNADERRILYVDTSAGASQTFDMQLYSTNPLQDSFEHSFALEVTDITYNDDSSAASWEFEFEKWDSMKGEKAIYNWTSGDDRIDVALKVTFQGALQREMVTFTISGTEDKENEIDDKYNNTRLSPKGGSSTDFQVLKVASSGLYFPYIDPSDPEDYDTHNLPANGSFSVTMWNLGSESDTMYITGWFVWQDNGDGIFSPPVGRAGEDIKNENFDIEFKTSSGAPYVLDQEITLTSGDSEVINGEIIPAYDNDLVPEGVYFVEIIVDSENGEPASTVLNAQMAAVMKPDFSIVSLDVDDYEVKEDDSVNLDGTIRIDWDRAGSVDYAFYVDGEVIEGSEGTVNFEVNENTKVVSYTWKAKTGEKDSRDIKLVVDPDNAISEQDETNNQQEVPIDVTEKDAKFPVWLLALVIGLGVVAVGAYWAYNVGPTGNVKIDSIIIRPDPPHVDSSGEIVAVIKNEGGSFEVGDSKNIVVSFYEDYESIGEKPVDLTTEGFEGGSTREITLAWKPAEAGLHNLNVAVDIDDEESDVSSRDIEIGE